MESILTNCIAICTSILYCILLSFFVTELENSMHMIPPIPPPPIVETPQAPPLPAVKPQYKTLRCPDLGVVSYSQSLVAEMTRCAADVALLKGHSFRVGWGRGNTLATLSTYAAASNTDCSLRIDQLETLVAGREKSDSSPAIVQCIQILPGQGDNLEQDFQVII